MNDFETLLERAQSGDLAAVDALLLRVYPRVRDLVHRRLDRTRRGALRRLAVDYSTNDIVQEIFLRVVQSLDRFDGAGEETLINYVSVLVRNALADRVRYHIADRRDVRRHASGPRATGRVPASGQVTPSKQVAANEQLAVYRQVLTTFSEREGRLLKMRIEGGVPFALLAEQLGYPSEDAARKAYHSLRVLLLLRLRRAGVDL